MIGHSALTGSSDTLPMLYGAPTSDFHDIVAGNSTNGTTTYNALVGYDWTTGIGTPRVKNVLTALGATTNAVSYVESTVELFTNLTTPDWFNHDNGIVWASDATNNRAYGPGDLWHNYGSSGEIPVTGVWKTGASFKSMGVFDPTNGTWHLDLNGDGTGNTTFIYGSPNDIPVVGDWNGLRLSEIGVYRPTTGYFYLDVNGDHMYDAGDAAFQFISSYQAVDKPVAGDWNHDGKSEIGIFRQGTWYLDSNGNHAYDAGTDRVAIFGQAGDQPIVGDWNGDGNDDIGIWRPSTSTFYLDTTEDFALTGADVSFFFDLSSLGSTAVGVYAFRA